MNERIKLLAEQAGSTHKQNLGVYQLYSDELEKFAQLIVQECADILMKPEYAMNHPEELSDYNKGWVNGRLLGIEHIKDHFGIEE
jgi:hypothetical protein